MCSGKIADLYGRALAVASVTTMLERVRRGQVKFGIEIIIRDKIDGCRKIQ